jgi:hypothetical protein
MDLKRVIKQGERTHGLTLYLERCNSLYRRILVRCLLYVDLHVRLVDIKACPTLFLDCVLVVVVSRYPYLYRYSRYYRPRYY